MKTTSYNPFDYLESPEEIGEYLDAAFADEDPRVFVVALGYLARKQGMSQVARASAVPRESLYKTLSCERNPCFDTVMKVAHALGLELHAVPVHA